MNAGSSPDRNESNARHHRRHDDEEATRLLRRLWQSPADATVPLPKHNHHHHHHHHPLPQLKSNRPTEELFQLIRQRSWESARYRILSRPVDARYVSPNQSTPLHAACLYRAPHDVIVALIRVWPVALLAQDAEGWIPLHVHLLYAGASQPDTAVEMIRAGGRPAASAHSPWLGAALHVACRHGAASAEILAELLRVAPEQVRVPNGSGCHPADLLWKSAHKRRLLHPEARADDLMGQLHLLLTAFKDNSTENHTLHDVVSFHFKCADQSDFVSFFLERNPQAAREVDPTTGQLPLHVAASFPYRRRDPPVSCARHRLAWSFIPAAVTLRPGRPPRDPLLTLLEAYPAAASRRADRGRGGGRFPLHVALSSRRGWGTGGVRELLAAAPDAVESRCPATGHYPFQLAAAAAANDDDDDDSSFDTIHQLLLAAPHLIHRGERDERKREP
jgi:hypothetical protein